MLKCLRGKLLKPYLILNQEQRGYQWRRWSEIVKEERELWPIHNLLPGGAFIR